MPRPDMGCWIGVQPPRPGTSPPTAPAAAAHPIRHPSIRTHPRPLMRGQIPIQMALRILPPVQPRFPKLHSLVITAASRDTVSASVDAAYISGRQPTYVEHRRTSANVCCAARAYVPYALLGGCYRLGLQAAAATCYGASVPTARLLPEPESRVPAQRALMSGRPAPPPPLCPRPYSVLLPLIKSPRGPGRLAFPFSFSFSLSYSPEHAPASRPAALDPSRPLRPPPVPFFPSSFPLFGLFYTLRASPPTECKWGPLVQDNWNWTNGRLSLSYTIKPTAAFSLTYTAQFGPRTLSINPPATRGTSYAPHIPKDTVCSTQVSRNAPPHPDPVAARRQAQTRTDQAEAPSALFCVSDTDTDTDAAHAAIRALFSTGTGMGTRQCDWVKARRNGDGRPEWGRLDFDLAGRGGSNARCVGMRAGCTV
ncbi:hypothetical protein FB451DRAFT_1558004 [Mycena latifolia]|nr:hypothetical protein FB451DRAFT_1558004 [Mycena latifolia]